MPMRFWCTSMYQFILLLHTAKRVLLTETIYSFIMSSFSYSNSLLQRNNDDVLETIRVGIWWWQGSESQLFLPDFLPLLRCSLLIIFFFFFFPCSFSSILPFCYLTTTFLFMKIYRLALAAPSHPLPGSLTADSQHHFKGYVA